MKKLISFLMIASILSACAPINNAIESKLEEINEEVEIEEVVEVEFESLERNDEMPNLNDYYQADEISYTASAPEYELPLNVESVTNFAAVNEKLNLSEEAQEKLKNNSFVVLDYGKKEDMIEVYQSVQFRNIPVFVTSDSLLHIYHIQFDNLLKNIEEEEFIADTIAMNNAFLRASIGQYESLTDERLKEAARRNVAYFAVARKLSQTEAAIPEYVSEEVEAELELIEAHSEYIESPIFKYKEDYTQYVARGHYTRSEDLEKYFQNMMWYGRLGFLIKGCSSDELDDKDANVGSGNCLIEESDADIQTVQAAMISEMLKNVKVLDSDVETDPEAKNCYDTPYDECLTAEQILEDPFTKADIDDDVLQQIKKDIE